MVEDNFDDESEDELQINCGIILVPPVEYNMVYKVSEVEEDFLQDEADN